MDRLHWITIKEAAASLNVTERTVQLAVQRGKYISEQVNGKGRGGKQLRILLESLPQEAQDRYNGIEPKRPARESGEAYTRLSDEKRKRVDEKVLAVTEYIKFKRTYHKQGVTREFLKRFSEEYPEIKINMGTLEDWVNKYAKNDIDGLIDRRGGHNKGSTSLTDDMQEVFLKYFLTDKKPSIKQCHTATEEYFRAKGIKIPSLSAFKRFIYTVPADVIAYHREGKKHYEDNFLPSIITDYNSDSLYSNREWIGDHHQCDVFVEYNGKIFRPWLSAWLDRKSRYVVGYVLNICDPNADIVLSSFATAVKKFGVPERIQIDNGKDYKVHDLFNLDNDYSLVSRLKADVKDSNPYNAKAKPIERFFRTFENYNKGLSSYVGDRPENRPPSMSGTKAVIKREQKAMNFDDFKKWVDNVINVYHNTPHSGDGMNGQTPFEAYSNGFQKPMRKISESALKMLLQRTTRTVTITKQGIKFAELPGVGYYSSDELLLYGIGKKVYARYDINDAKEVYVYSETGKFICVAQSEALFIYGAGHEVQSSVIRENNKRKKALRNKAKSYYPDIDVPTMQEVVANRSAAFGTPDFSNIPTKDYTQEIDIPDKPVKLVSESEEQPHTRKDPRLNLGNIGKKVM